MTLVRSGARQPFSGGVMFYVYLFFIFYLFIFYFIIFVIVSLGPLHPVLILAFHICSPFLGGYGDRTHGVYQHLMVTEAFKNPTKKIFRPLSMLSTIV